MKLKYLGTAAYEGVPSLFCDCVVCRKSKRTGGKNLRSRSQALVNDDLLIDFPADTVWHSHAYGLDWMSVFWIALALSVIPALSAGVYALARAIKKRNKSRFCGQSAE